jgi:hypothetical protein
MLHTRPTERRHYSKFIVLMPSLFRGSDSPHVGCYFLDWLLSVLISIRGSASSTNWQWWQTGATDQQSCGS